LGSDERVLDLRPLNHDRFLGHSGQFRTKQQTGLMEHLERMKDQKFNYLSPDRSIDNIHIVSHDKRDGGKAVPFKRTIAERTINPDQDIGRLSPVNSGRGSGMSRNNLNHTTTPSYLRKGRDSDRKMELKETMAVRHPELSKKTYF
jgi:hypothetical protein